VIPIRHPQFLKKTIFLSVRFCSFLLTSFLRSQELPRRVSPAMADPPRLPIWVNHKEWQLTIPGELFLPTMTITAQGNLFIADRFNNRIRKGCFSGLPILLLSSANTNNTGTYSVVVTSPFGMVVSSNILLTVINQPAINVPTRRADGSPVLSLPRTPNINSRIYTATNLTPPIVWLPLYTNSHDGNWQFVDTNADGISAKYYRVSTP
jgi:hypothetical protein